MLALALAAPLAAHLPARPASALETGAELQQARGLHWERFDPRTRKKVWDIIAKEARAEQDGSSYRIDTPTVVIFGSDYDVHLSSKSGFVKREADRGNTFVLEGNVVAEITDPGKTVVRTERVEWLAAERLLQSDAAVEVRRTDFRVVGEGMELVPQQDGKDVKLIRLKKNTKAAISPQASRSAMFGAVTGKAELIKDDAPAPPEMRISSDGPMTINRDSSAVDFERNVQVQRGTFRMRCDKMRVTFDKRTQQARDIICEGAVEAADGENGARCSSLTWDAASGLAELSGTPDKPAQTWRGSSTVSAPIIWISKDNSVLWSGRVHIFAPPEGPSSLIHFGGGRQ